jgi:very-short-patch-repair endonuclease
MDICLAPLRLLRLKKRKLQVAKCRLHKNGREQMKHLLLMLGVMLIACLAGLAPILLKRLKLQSLSNQQVLPDFTANKPLTEREQVFYFRLIEAASESVVLAQVQVSCLMSVRGAGRQAWFNKISRKSVDYVVCRKDFSVIAAIELDDNSHNRADRQSADKDKDTALEAAGIRLLRFKGGELPSAAVLKMAIERADKEGSKSV